MTGEHGSRMHFIGQSRHLVDDASIRSDHKVDRGAHCLAPLLFQGRRISRVVSLYSLAERIEPQVVQFGPNVVAVTAVGLGDFLHISSSNWISGCQPKRH